MTADVMASDEMIEIQRDESSEGDAVPLIKHNLHSTWCLWVNMFQGKKDRKEQWANANAMVHTLNTVEDFWCLYNNINGPSQLMNGDISLFKQGISPAWEDPACANGGRWVIKLDKVRDVDETWLNLILALIGEETFDDGDNDIVCGAVLSTRKAGSRKLAVWLKTAQSGPITRVGNKFMDIMKSTMSMAELSFENFSKQAYTAHLKFPPAPA
jgi:translation initiation factor 4E